MRILLVAATPPESGLLRDRLGVQSADQGLLVSFSFGSHSLQLLHTGIGMVNTAYHLGRYLLQNKPELAIQFGIAGAFEGDLENGEAVEVVKEIYAEMGAESPDGFLDLNHMGFPNFYVGEEPQFNVLHNPAPLSQGRGRKSITVNRVHGRPESIREIQQLWSPEVESMEGAAFFQCCLMNQVPFAEFRGISNRVEVRNREAWDIPAAIEAVTDLLIAQLNRID